MTIHRSTAAVPNNSQPQFAPPTVGARRNSSSTFYSATTASNPAGLDAGAATHSHPQLAQHLQRPTTGGGAAAAGVATASALGFSIKQQSLASALASATATDKRRTMTRESSISSHASGTLLRHSEYFRSNQSLCSCNTAVDDLEKEGNQFLTDVDLLPVPPPPILTLNRKPQQSSATSAFATATANSQHTATIMTSTSTAKPPATSATPASATTPKHTSNNSTSITNTTNTTTTTATNNAMNNNSKTATITHNNQHHLHHHHLQHHHQFLQHQHHQQQLSNSTASAASAATFHAKKSATCQSSTLNCATNCIFESNIRRPALLASCANCANCAKNGGGGGGKGGGSGGGCGGGCGGGGGGGSSNSSTTTACGASNNNNHHSNTLPSCLPSANGHATTTNNKTTTTLNCKTPTHKQPHHHQYHQTAPITPNHYHANHERESLQSGSLKRTGSKRLLASTFDLIACGLEDDDHEAQRDRQRTRDLDAADDPDSMYIYHNGSMHPASAPDHQLAHKYSTIAGSLSKLSGGGGGCQQHYQHRQRLLTAPYSTGRQFHTNHLYHQQQPLQPHALPNCTGSKYELTRLMSTADGVRHDHELAQCLQQSQQQLNATQRARGASCPSSQPHYHPNSQFRQFHQPQPHNNDQHHTQHYPQPYDTVTHDSHASAPKSHSLSSLLCDDLLLQLPSCTNSLLDLDYPLRPATTTTTTATAASAAINYRHHHNSNSTSHNSHHNHHQHQHQRQQHQTLLTASQHQLHHTPHRTASTTPTPTPPPPPLHQLAQQSLLSAAATKAAASAASVAQHHHFSCSLGGGGGGGLGGGGSQFDSRNSTWHVHPGCDGLVAAASSAAGLLDLKSQMALSDNSFYGSKLWLDLNGGGGIGGGGVKSLPPHSSGSQRNGDVSNGGGGLDSIQQHVHSYGGSGDRERQHQQQHHHHHHQLQQQHQQQQQSNNNSIPWRHRQCPSVGSSNSSTTIARWNPTKHWLAVTSILLIVGAVGVAVPLALRVSDGASFEERLHVANQLLDTVPLIDGHNDLPWNIRKFLHNQINDFNFDVNLTTVLPWSRSNWSHTDLYRLKKGKVSAQFWAAYVPCDAQHKDAVQLTLEQIDVIIRLTDKYRPKLTMCNSAYDIVQAHKNQQLCSFAGVEGGHSIGGSLSVLRMFYALGVRYMTLTSTCHTTWADCSSADAPHFDTKHGGLTEHGKTIVREMNRIGMIVDLSHVSVMTMRDTLATSEAPVIFSHSSAYALCNSSRNVQDDILRLVSKNGGLVMINLYSKFLTCSENSSVHDVVDHINHVRQVAGVDHVGIGAGFDGINHTPTGLEDVSTYPVLFSELLGGGWTADDLTKLAGQNFIRVLAEVEALRDKKKSAGLRPYEDVLSLRAENPFNCSSKLSS